MKKLLIVGRFDMNVSNLQKYLTYKFKTQICSEKYDVVAGMLKVEKPDMIVVCLFSMYATEPFDSKVLDFFSEEYPDIPVLMVGSAEECRAYASYYHEVQFDYMTRPTVQSEVMAMCCERLGLTEGKDEEYWGIDKDEFKKKEILVVDDSPLALRTIKSMLDEHYEVSVVKSGDKAIEQAKKILPDLILLDYEMPGWDGKRTLEELRKDEETKHIPVVFLTGVADKEHITAVLEMHPQGYLLKPVECEKLLVTLRNVIGE